MAHSSNSGVERFDGSQVPVDYTLVRNVSKPQGARPGSVIFVKNRTVYVKPSLGEQL